MTIPVYPEFKAIELEDFSAFDQALKKAPPVISELTFTNIFAWRQAYKFESSLLGGFIVLRSLSSGRQIFFPPIGEGGAKGVIEEVFRGEKRIFSRLPESTGRLFENDPGYKLTPDRDNFDYLYYSEELISLAGKKFDGKRNLIKKFKSLQKYEYVEFSASDIEECLVFEEDWCKLKNCEAVQGLASERLAIRQMLENFSRFELVAGGIRVDAKIRAIAIGQELNPQALVIHVLKADPDMAGLYQLMNNEFVSRAAVNYRYVNMEQDLGVEGLRKAKLSYHPAAMVNKYTLELKG